MSKVKQQNNGKTGLFKATNVYEYVYVHIIYVWMWFFLYKYVFTPGPI